METDRGKSCIRTCTLGKIKMKLKRATITIDNGRAMSKDIEADDCKDSTCGASGNCCYSIGCLHTQDVQCKYYDGYVQTDNIKNNKCTGFSASIDVRCLKK